MADENSPEAGLSLTDDYLAELFDTTFEFNDRPAPIPADIRADWRVPLLMLIVSSCRGRRASLQQVQAIAAAAIFEESREVFLRSFAGEADPAALLIRYDPAVTRAANLAVGLDLLSWQNKSRLGLTTKGEAMLEAILADGGAFVEERSFLSDLGGKIPMSSISRMLEP